MSITAVAYSVIGIKIPGYKIFKKERVRAYEHSYPENYQFDPVTRETLWRDVDICLLTEEEDEPKFTGNQGTIFELIRVSYYSKKEDTDYYFGLVTVLCRATQAVYCS